MTRQIEAYRDTLQDIEKTLGTVPGFMKFFPKERLVQDWSSWKSLGEINLERARYLLNTDELLEEMLGETQSKITDNRNAEFSNKSKAIRCEVRVDVNPTAKTNDMFLFAPIVSESY